MIEHGFFIVGSVPEWLKGTGCKPVGYAYLGSNPSAPTTDVPTLHMRRVLAHIAQSVEHFLGKEEVTGSSPVVGSRLSPRRSSDRRHGGVAQLVRAHGSYP